MARGGKRRRPRFVPQTRSPVSAITPVDAISEHNSATVAPIAEEGSPVSPLLAGPGIEVVPPASCRSLQVIPISSYTSLVNPNEGNSLKFIPTSIINGTKCDKIMKEDVEPKVEYWKNAVLCSVLGANPPLEVIRGYINRI